MRPDPTPMAQKNCKCSAWRCPVIFGGTREEKKTCLISSPSKGSKILAKIQIRHICIYSFNARAHYMYGIYIYIHYSAIYIYVLEYIYIMQIILYIYIKTVHLSSTYIYICVYSIHVNCTCIHNCKYAYIYNHLHM